MNIFLSASVLCLNLLSFSAFAQGFSFQDAIDAHKSGNFSRTIELILPAAQVGNTDAQNLLCYMYKEGQGVTQSFLMANQWCLKAAEMEHELAQFNMGVAYEDGIGEQMDHAKAYEWYVRSALNGYTPAKFKVLENFAMCRDGVKEACAAIKQAGAYSEQFYNKELSSEQKTR